MPNILTGDMNAESPELGREDYDYDYPDGLDLRPDSKLHKKIKNAVLERARDSSTIMANRHSSWQQTDKFLTAYSPTDAKEQKVKWEDERKPVSIIFPYSYAIMETTLAYLVSAFFQDPYFRYEGTGPEDVIGSILMELTVQHNCMKNKIGLPLHTMLRDGTVYGIGVGYPYWDVRRGKRRKKREVGGMFGLFTKTEEYEDDTILYEGNALRNIDPYLFLPDVNVPITDLQRGEYVGWMEPDNYHDLLSEEENDEDMFNVEYLKHLKGKRSSIYATDDSGRNIRTGMTKPNNTSVTSPIDVIYMFIKLIPHEWGLGSKRYPEKWLFELAQDEVVIKARPAGFDHGRFPVVVTAPDYDGYSTAPLSRLEILGGLQGTLDWLFNSHIANVRKAINDMIVYDPYMINSKDLKSPEPGKLIRTRRPVWGRGVKDAVQQLVVNDITRNNIADSTWIVQWMQKIAGTDDPMMGSMRQGGPERLTAKEFGGTAAGAVSRMERVAKVIGLQAFQDLGEFFAAHTQQMMEEETYMKITGEWQDVLLQEYGKKHERGRISVSPYDLMVNYDCIVRDGSIPGGNFSDAWIQLFNILATNPELGSKFDTVRIFSHIARNLGAKNVNDFVIRGGNIKPELQGQEQVENQVQQGNLIPFQGA